MDKYKMEAKNMKANEENQKQKETEKVLKRQALID